MFTYENICADIKSLEEGPITQKTAAALAHLLYIKKNLCESDGAGKEGRDVGEHGLTSDMVMAWVNGMENADGTIGPTWSMEKTEGARIHMGIDCDPLAFYAAMNMVYSDYCMVAKKFSVDSLDFYAALAKAFLDDKDARYHGAEKLLRYHKYVVT